MSPYEIYRVSPVRLSGRLHFLDALRGLAALSVMFFHFFARGVSPLHDELAASLPARIGAILAHMFGGVDVFFVLSGFVVAFSMDGRRTDWRYAGNYILRRSLRLDPPYWAAAGLMLGFLLLMSPAKYHDFYLEYGGVQGLLANLFYVQNLSFVYPARSILDVSWTLCLEVQFYLTFLAILVVGHYVGRRVPIRGAQLQRAVVTLSVAAVAVWSFTHSVRAPTSDLSGWAWTFFLGTAVYGAVTRGIPSLAIVLPLAALGVFFLVRKELDGSVAVATAAAIYGAGRAGRLSTLLAHGPLLYLGKISYSLYLLHMVIGLNVLFLLRPTWLGSFAGGWCAWALAAVLSLAAAHLLYRLVEAPSNRLSRRFKRRASPAAARGAVARAGAGTFEGIPP